MGIQGNSLINSEKTTTFTPETYSPSRNQRCIYFRKNYTLFFKYLSWVVIFGWCLLSLISLAKTSYVQERQICPYSEIWTYLVASLISDLSIVICVIKRIQTQEELLFPYLPIELMWTLGIKCFVFSIWGTLIFYSFSCTHKLDNTILFWVSLYHYLFNVVIGGTIGLLSLKVYVNQEELSDEQSQPREPGSPNGDRTFSVEV